MTLAPIANRWHEAIPPVVTAQPGDRVVLETRDALDGQFTPTSTTDDVTRADLMPVHPLTGPVFVEGAEPGDLLEVRIEEIRPEPFGFTTQIAGFGFLRDVFTAPHIVRWQIADGWATSDDLPGVKIPGAPFMGVIGVAPSSELRAILSGRSARLGPERRGRCNQQNRRGGRRYP